MKWWFNVWGNILSFSKWWWLMRRMLLPLKIWVDSWYYVLKTQHFKRTVCLSLQNIPYIFLLQGAVSGRCSTAWGQNEISCQSKMFLSLVSLLALKACNIEASTTLSFEHGATGRNLISYMLSLILIGPIQYFIAKPIVL